MVTESKTINVLGTDIKIHFRKESEGEKLEGMDGYFDGSQSMIVVKVITPDKRSLGDLEKYQREVLRHEILHAFLHESGLDASSSYAPSWATNEEMVDWFAIQSPKIFKIYKELGLV